LAGLGLLMGRSLRYVATAPTRLLDEQFRARRNAAHAVAWRILVGSIAVVVLGLFLAVSDQPDEALALSYAQIYLGGAGLLFLSLFLPSIVLAWTLPEESDPDD
jgi:protein-S-isoprenylcysteine O-methyltransferase Ste14